MKELLNYFTITEWLKIITSAIVIAPVVWLVMASIIIIGG